MSYPAEVEQEQQGWPSPAAASAIERPTAATPARLWARRLAVALTFAVLFTLIGWRELNPLGFPDLENYRTGFESEWYLFNIQNLGVIDFILAEGVWVWSFDALAFYVGDTETAFGIVSFVSMFLIAWYVACETRSLFYLPALINPGFVNLVLEQLRSGIATGIFLLAVRASNLLVCVALCLLASSIHTAFWLLGGVLVAYRLIRNVPIYQSLMSRPVMGGVLVVLAGLVIGVLRTAVLAFIGDERAFIQEQYTSGLLLSLAWMMFAGWFAYNLKNKVRDFEASFLLFCSTLAFVSAYQALYGSRFFAIGATMFPVLLYRMPAHLRLITAVAYAVFSAIWFSLWFQ
jgi:hypothetical protein